jgi:hypothetical protein
MEVIQFIEGNLVPLITSLAGLICTGISVFYAIKNWIALLKTKKASEI